MTRTVEEQKQIAVTIIEQLGGQQMKAMTGAYGFVALESGVQFRFRGSRKANSCRVILDAMDTYTFELWKIGRKTPPKMVYQIDGAYDDMLIPVFEEQTGLYTHL